MSSIGTDRYTSVSSSDEVSLGFLNKRYLILLGIVMIAAASVTLIVMESGRNFVKTVPGTMEILATVHNSLNRTITPEEAGNGLPAGQIVFIDPAGVAEDSLGNVYISDRAGLIWKIDISGTATVIAGTGRRGRSPEGIMATETALGAPQGIAVDSQNRLHMADSFNNVVLRIELDGTIRRVAGTGYVGYQGDGGLAVNASLDEPFDIQFDSQDNLYIVEFGNNWVRKVDQQGIISTVAGSGEAGFSGDGGQAKSALLDGPYGLYLDSNDRLYIADSGNNVIRMVSESGIITTIAGRKKRGYAGDGGLASDALLDSPQFLTVEDNGWMFIGDEHNRAIRAVAPEGTISTLISDGTLATPGQSDANLRAIDLDDPEALLPQPDGSILIVDGGNARVMRLRSDGTVEHFAGKSH